MQAFKTAALNKTPLLASLQEAKRQTAETQANLNKHQAEVQQMSEQLTQLQNSTPALIKTLTEVKEQIAEAQKQDDEALKLSQQEEEEQRN